MIRSDPFLAIAFLSPGFLVAGCALAAAPIIIHLLNRRRFRVTRWAAMEFLLAAIKKNRRRLQFESWLLLAVRCLAVLLLGLALARPMGCSNSSLAALGQRSSLNVFIIDNSYSMAYRFPRASAQTHLDQAKVIAHALVSRMQPGSEGAVLLTAADPAGEIISQPTYDLASANTAIDSITQTAAGTDLSGAFKEALSIAQQNSSLPNKHLFIFSDSTRSALEGPQTADLRALASRLASEYAITYFNLGQLHQENVAVSDVRPADSVLTTKFPADFLATVRGFNAPSTHLQWKLDGRVIGDTQSAATTDGTTATLDNIAITTGGTHILSVTAADSDPLLVDNTCNGVFNVATEMKVLLVEGDRSAEKMTGSAAFLSIALDPAGAPGKPSPSYIQPTTISDLQLSGQMLSDYRVVVLANVPSLDASEATTLQRYVQAGGTLMLFMGELVRADNYNQLLLPRGLLPGALQRRMNAPSSAPFHFDFHANAALPPPLEFLHNQPRSGLDTTEVNSYWQVDVPADSKAERVLNFLAPSANPPRSSAPTHEDPAITLQSLGSGRVVFVATTADAQWNTLPAKPVYVPLMHELLRNAIVRNDTWMNLEVGQPLVIPQEIKLAALPVLTSPSGTRIALQANNSSPPLYQSAPLVVPGLYQLDTGSASYPVAVNPPSAEADARTESPAAVRALLGDIPMTMESDQPPAMTQNAEGRDFGWTAMCLVLGLLGAECAMAMKFGHYRT